MRTLVTNVSTVNKQVARNTRLSNDKPRLKPRFIPLLSYGFRPFFLGAGLWATTAMVLWVGFVSGEWTFANHYGTASWHAHELLFGYVSAVIAGFLLTAIPNWTGRLPIQGGSLLALFLLWALGRMSFLASDWIGIITAISVDSVFLFALAGVILREIVAGKNWRNLSIICLVVVLGLSNLWFHVEVLFVGSPNRGIRLATAIIIGLMMLVGGRITPNFTRNWLLGREATRMPALFGRIDVTAFMLATVALVVWIPVPLSVPTGLLLFSAAAAQGLRLSRWAVEQTWREPLVLILHAGYAFIPLGFLMLAVSALRPQLLGLSDALHVWTVGAVGVMTLAVMTRASLGHTGRDLTATAATRLIYVAIIAAVLARTTAPFFATFTFTLLSFAGIAWIIAFGTFVLSYGPMLVNPRRTIRVP